MIIKKYFLSLIATFFFNLPVHAAYCPSPEAIKPSCKVLVTKAMVKTKIMEHLKEYNLEKLDNQVVEKITLEINKDPKSLFTTFRPRFDDKDPYNQLVLAVADKLNINAYLSNNYNKVKKMLEYLHIQAREACFYKNTHLNLIGKEAIDLHLAGIKKFESAYFFSNATNPSIKGTLTRCSYLLANGRRFDLMDNDQEEHKPQFKLNDEYKKHWKIINKWGVYECKGDTVKNCPFKLER